MAAEILEVEAVEVSNDPLVAKIEQDLIKANVTEAVIAALNDTYGTLRLKGIEDKESYLELKAARKEIRRVGILAETACELGRAAAVKEQKLWLAKQKEVLGKIGKVQDPIDADIKKFDDEVARKEAEEKKRQEEAFIKRQSELLKYGARYENGSYILNHISYESNNIQEADEEVYTDIILPKYKKQFEANEAERVAEETKRQQEAAKLKEEQEVFAKQQAEFKEQQEQFNKQKSETERLQREERIRIETEEKQRQQLEESKERERIGKLQSERLAMVMPFNYRGADIDIQNLWTLSEEKFNEVYVDIAKKYEIEQKRLQEEAATKERERIEEENRKKEVLRQQELQKQQEEAAKASDKQKWAQYLFDITLVKFPELKSSIYKSKLAMAKEKLSEIASL